MARSLALLLPILVLRAATPAAAQAGPPPARAPAPLAASVSVPRHVRHAYDHLATATAPDDVGRQALSEAHASLSSAEAALKAGELRTADELAASVDDLVHAASGPPPRGPEADPAGVLTRVATMASVLATLPDRRVRGLLVFANDVANRARREAASNDPGAGREAARAEAIARAATHVAIATDPTLAPPLPPPPQPPHKPPPDPSS